MFETGCTASDVDTHDIASGFLTFPIIDQHRLASHLGWVKPMIVRYIVRYGFHVFGDEHLFTSSLDVQKAMGAPWRPKISPWEDDFPSGNGNDRVPSDFGFGCETQCSD